MKRFIAGAVLGGFIAFLILFGYAGYDGYVNGQIKNLYSVLIVDTIILIVIFILSGTVAAVFSGGRRIAASIMLPKGSIIRLIAVSFPDNDGSGYLGALVEIKAGKVRYLMIHNPPEGVNLIPGHYYRYVGWNKLEVAPFGKL